jgi:AraC-like DNA-binding protein
MEEKLAIRPEPWTGFLVEFPTLPKAINPGGREESQRVLFLCPTTETNATELCLALFGRQIVMQRLKAGEAPASLTGARFVFVYAAQVAADLPAIMAPFRNLQEVPILVTYKGNVVRSARVVTEYLSRAAHVAPMRNWENREAVAESGATEPAAAPAKESSLYSEPLPRIELIDEDGKLVIAATDLQDYRAEYACRYVLAHFQENINRDRMAEMVNLSPGYFSNLFRAEVGMSFSDYLIQVRIENAKGLLRRFELSVEAISKRCGFNSLAHFSRTFKDRCGLSPLKYRKSPHLVN